MTAVSKVALTRKDGQGSLVLPFNPEDITLSAQAGYSDVGSSRDGSGAVQYTGRSPRTLDLTVRLDARGSTKPLKATVEMLFGWTVPTRASVRANRPEPPVLAMTWGRQTWFDVRITNVSAHYTLFTADGLALRAECSLGLQEVVTATPRQNPTSGGITGNRVHVVIAGDGLHSLATKEYGTPARWRDLALANDIDDPLAVPPGTRLLLPAAAELPPVRSR